MFQFKMMHRSSLKVQMNKISPKRQQSINQLTFNLQTNASQIPLLRPPNLKSHRSNQSLKDSSKQKKQNQFQSLPKILEAQQQIKSKVKNLSQIQLSLLRQNNNLKNHNIFLLKQIQIAFKREKKYRKKIEMGQNRIRQLQSINLSLQNQIKNINQKIIKQITQLQKMMSHKVADSYIKITADMKDIDTAKSLNYQSPTTSFPSLQKFQSNITKIMNQNQLVRQYMSMSNSAIMLNRKQSTSNKQLQRSKSKQIIKSYQQKMQESKVTESGMYASIEIQKIFQIILYDTWQ